eukprot:352864-Rhodomonas_salina.2
MQPGVAHSSIHTARAIHSTQSVNSTERVNGSSRCWCVACTWTEIRSRASGSIRQGQGCGSDEVGRRREPPPLPRRRSRRQQRCPSTLNEHRRLDNLCHQLSNLSPSACVHEPVSGYALVQKCLGGYGECGGDDAWAHSGFGATAGDYGGLHPSIGRILASMRGLTLGMVPPAWSRTFGPALPSSTRTI